MFAETVDDIIAAFRSDVDDVTSSDGSDNLWSAADVLRYLNEAVDKTAKATLSLQAVINLPVTANNPVVTLPARVLHIRHARLASNNGALVERNADEVTYGLSDDYGYVVPGSGALFGLQAGTPRAYVRDYEVRGLRLLPASAVNDTLILQCSATIGGALELGDDMPLTDPEDQALVLMWMKKLAYSKHDAETLDLRRAAEYEQMFRDVALERNAAVRSYRRRPGTVRMAW